MEKTAKKATKFGKFMDSLKRIAYYRAIRGVIKSVTQAMADGLEKAYLFSSGIIGEGHRFAQAMDNMKSATNQMKGQLGSAFISLLTAIEPILVSIINLVTRAADAIAQFLAAFTGTTYIRAQATAARFADDMNSGARAAKEWKNQLMGFDVINRLEEPSRGGGSGVNPLEGYQFEETPINENILALVNKLKELSSSLKLSFNDVLLDWSDLNPEQVVQKVISGLSMFLGGSLGFVVAGVPGAIVGTLAGFGLSLMINGITFDHDGVISKEEMANGLTTVLNSLVGAAVGFVFGGPGGAFLGATIGLGLTLLIEKILPTLGAGSTKDIISDIVDGLKFGVAGGVGAAVGFTLGGPGGAVVGALLGLGLTFVVGKIKTSFSSESERAKYKDGLSWFVCGVLGLPTNEELKQWGINAISWIGEGFWNFAEELHWIIGDPIERFVENLVEWWNGLSLKPFHIPRPQFEWTYSEASGILARALEFVGLPPTIPHLNISWNARGGIVDGATLIGAGEAGKEAIIPLERNTEWMSRLAAELNYRQQEQMGSDDDVIAAIYAVGSQIVTAIADNSGSGEIDWRKVASNVTKYQNQMARAGAY